ncbi:hypothetical protein CDL15_Pgr001003 [Punica granatum]|uniref:Uncharacterized protein n=1 Tax=Punica granatum TaxID=22663 RepID=A0A218XI03_PUNGR|nr:hypothetical protein CDL15_Pgr001003 [Punica granatum]PKI68288.1 hypothetical protein CRG98_011318 [Punica granatum]
MHGGSWELSDPWTRAGVAFGWLVHRLARVECELERMRRLPKRRIGPWEVPAHGGMALELCPPCHGESEGCWWLFRGGGHDSRKSWRKETHWEMGEFRGGATDLGCCGQMESSNGETNITNGLGRSNTCGIRSLFKVRVELGCNYWKIEWFFDKLWPVLAWDKLTKFWSLVGRQEGLRGFLRAKDLKRK